MRLTTRRIDAHWTIFAEMLTTLLELSALLGFTWWLLGQYKDAYVDPVAHSAVFVSWTLGFLSVLLLPIDLIRNGFFEAANATAATGEADEDARANYLAAWRALYWVAFLMSWLVLPFLAEFCQDGEFVLNKRIVSSLARLVFHWKVLAAVCGIVAVYLVCVGHFSMYGLLGLAMATANTYGLLWAISLLGYGLVDIPRSFWTLRFPESQLKELYFHAVRVHEEHIAAIFLHEDVAGAVSDCYERMLHAESASIILTSDMQFVKTCLLQVKEIAEHDGSNSNASPLTSATTVTPGSSSWRQYKRDRKSSRRATVAGSPFTSSSNAPTLREVIDLHRQLKLAKADLRRSEQSWIELCIQAELLHDRATKRELSPASLFPSTSLVNHVRNLFISTRYQLRRIVTAPISICCACVTGFASLCILWGELTMDWSSTSSLSLFHAFAHTWGPHASELLAFLALLYLVLCAYSSLVKLRLFGKFALLSHHNSTERSLLQTSIYQCRLQFAIGYNFLLLLGDRELTNRTAFAALFENMRIVHVFGDEFSVYAPMVMVLLAVVTLGNGYAHVMKQFGIEQYEQVVVGNLDHETQIAKGEGLVRAGLEKYRHLISRRKKEFESNAAYGYARTNDSAQALLLGQDEEEEVEDEAVGRRDGDDR